jgi:pSer/pThr/pTyr-binding forkhead associated (FHA) protein
LARQGPYQTIIQEEQMAQSFQLTVKAGPNPGKVYEFDQDEVVVGRDLGNDIVVSDADISRRHAHLVRQGDAYLVEDLGSTNGTYVNGTRLSGPQLLEGGESILFGSSVEMEYAPVAYDVNATVITPPPAVEPAVVEPALVEPAMVEPAVVVPAVIEAPAPDGFPARAPSRRTRKSWRSTGVERKRLWQSQLTAPQCRFMSQPRWRLPQRATRACGSVWR